MHARWNGMDAGTHSFLSLSGLRRRKRCACTHSCTRKRTEEEYVSVRLHVNMSAHMSMHMSICMSMHMSMHMSIHMSICMSIHMHGRSSQRRLQIFSSGVQRHALTHTDKPRTRDVRYDGATGSVWFDLCLDGPGSVNIPEAC